METVKRIKNKQKIIQFDYTNLFQDPKMTFCDPVWGRDPQFEKPCDKGTSITYFITS